MFIVGSDSSFISLISSLSVVQAAQGPSNFFLYDTYDTSRVDDIVGIGMALLLQL